MRNHIAFEIPSATCGAFLASLLGTIALPNHGYAIYGPRGESSESPKDLAACNGHTDAVRGYYYVATERYPYLIGGYGGLLPAWSYSRG